MAYLRAQDTISGQEGKITFDIDNNVEFGGFVKKVEAKFEKQKTEVKTLGKRGTQHKANGWNGTGSFTLYYVTSKFRKMALDYAKNGKDVYFTVTVENDDPTSTIGKQTVVLYNCNIDSMILASVDVDSEVLEEDMEFTFDDFDILDEFGNPMSGATE